MYPTNDWYVELLKDYTVNKRMNFSVNGGGKVARYYVSIAGSQDNGILNVPKLNDLNNNIDYKQIQLSSNVNISLTSSNGMKLSFSGNIGRASSRERVCQSVEISVAAVTSKNKTQ